MKNNKGFTLTELLVTIAIMGIMAAIAMPSMTTFISNSRVANRAEQAANLFRYAKGEAVRLNMPVIICGDTVRKDGRPNGQCTANVYADSTSGGLKAFGDKNKNGEYLTKDEDINLRTISINGSSAKTVEFKLEYCDIAGSDCKEPTSGKKELVFMPNGKFGIKEGKDLSNISLGGNAARIVIQDARKPDDTLLRRYVVIAPSGNVSICSHDDSSSNPFCK